ncbi:unnamed protein product [Schistosoma curassoni]|uniref:Uncharacterized protein n=1 Tax=Schistosoma curassoni TaxID=6186 RepID=A0A183KR71_9TREM|nr:unnamed protein product [Schistosoma curassoni]
MDIRQIESGKSEKPANTPDEKLKSDNEVIANMLHKCLLTGKKNTSSRCRRKEIQTNVSKYKCEDWQINGHVPAIEEHLKLKTTINKYQRRNLQYEHQDCCTVQR